MTEHSPVADGTGPPTPVVSVRAEATREVPPELARLWVTVAAEDRDRRTALDKLSRRNAEFLAVVKSYGDAVARVETGSLSVYPVLQQKSRGEKVRHYRGAVRSCVTVTDFTVLGELSGRVADMEMTDLAGPQWGLWPDSPVRRQARADAAREAVARAAQYAGAVGGRLTALLELADVGMSAGTETPRFAVARAATMAAPAGAEPPVFDLEPQTQTVHASVEARFTMTQPAVLGP